MTVGDDGTPENDDPFGYLYRSENGEQQAAPPTSYNQVQRVGERRSPQQQGGYGYPQTQQPGAYGYPPQQPRQQPQYAPGQPGDGGGHRSPGHGGEPRNRKGLLIAAVAVVAAVAIGIAIAMAHGSGDDKNQADDKPTTPPPASTPASAPTKSTPSAAPSQFSSQKVDASTFALAGGAKTSTQWPGANAANGTYVDNMGQVGASATWTVTVPKDGEYTFFVDYGNAGADATLSLAVNGKMRSTPVKLNNWGHATEWAKAWDNTTFAYVNLTKGQNTLQLSFQANNTGVVNLDQTWLKQGQVTK